MRPVSYSAIAQCIATLWYCNILGLWLVVRYGGSGRRRFPFEAWGGWCCGRVPCGGQDDGQVTELIMWAYTMYESMQWAIASCSETPLSFAFWRVCSCSFYRKSILPPFMVFILSGVLRSRRMSLVWYFRFVECLSSRWNHRLFIHDFLPSFFLHTLASEASSFLSQWKPCYLPGVS